MPAVRGPTEGRQALVEREFPGTKGWNLVSLMLWCQ